jgi:acetyltransferase
LKGRGLGQLLMKKLIAYFRQRGTDALVGEAMSDNKGMLELVRNLGFSVHAELGTGIAEMKMKL